MINFNLYLIDQYPGESLMIDAIHECREWNHEACCYPYFRGICWL